ncbi:MAG: InlB B-repeat-containing protein, partial [Clostridia bacterium]|nr:InlB B-repeat-containing protein [Clostridia bacterium]
ISSVQTETRVDGKAVLTWSKSKNDTALANVFNGKVEGDMILYSAEYAPVIDFNSMGGKEVNSIVNRAGNTISLPTPKRENYTFMGWFDTAGNKFEATAMPENSLTLNAKWQANIMLNENGGTDVQDITAPVGEPIELPTPERAGYIFAGWYDASGNKYENKAMPENSIVLTAKYWAIKNESITLIDATTVSDATRTAPEFPNNTDYDACEFVEVIDLSKNFNKDIKNIKITAHYKAKPEINTTNKLSLDLSYYAQPVASDAYLMWHTQEIFTNYSEEYTIFTRETNLELTSNVIYVCIWNQYTLSKSSSRYATDLTDFWVEIEYPDTSVLY